MTALMDREELGQRRTNGLSRGAGERFMGSPAQAGDAGLVVTPGGGGYRDGNPYTANELVTLALTTREGGSDLLQSRDIVFEISAGEFAATGTTNSGVGGSFVDLPAAAQIGCGGKRALLPAGAAGKTGLGMMTLPGTGDVTIRAAYASSYGPVRVLEMNLRQGAAAAQDCPPDVPGCAPAGGAAAPTAMCDESPPQFCRMLCPAPVCAAGECAMRQGSCCDMSCQSTGTGGGGGGGGGSSCPEDIDGDGLVNGEHLCVWAFSCFTSLTKKRCAVNDLLSMLSAFGSDGSDGEDVDGDGTVNVNDLLQLLSAFGSDDCAAGGGGGATCVMGDDCGGQQRTECGTNCPPKCGEPPAGFCVFSCFVGFQCPVRPYILSSMLPSSCLPC